MSNHNISRVSGEFNRTSPQGGDDNKTFASLGISPFFIEALAQRGIISPTEIQRLVIPRLFNGAGFIFRSATGTGKTFAYLLPLFERLLAREGEAPAPRERPRLLIAAPTFELCAQIKSEADFLLKHAPVPLKAALLIGQASGSRQAETLKRERPEIIIGNPGRINSLAAAGKLKLTSIDFVVLDEGDRLAQDDLFGDTNTLLCRLTRPFLGISCSATFPPKSRRLLLPLLKIEDSPASVVEEIAPGEVLKENVTHWAIYSEGRDKFNTLRSLIAALSADKKVKALIFLERGSDAERLFSLLARHKYPAANLSGGMDKQNRKRTLDQFRAGKIRLLVSSDLAARGLDISGLTHIIALDVAEDKNTYIHRAGRTGRAGNKGICISIGTEGEMRRLASIEKSLGLKVYPKELHEGKILAPRQI